jgi:hypothetical protein
LERFQMQLAKVTDGAKVRARLSHNGEKGQIAFARQGDLAARKHPHAVGIEQQAHHHGRIERRRTPGFLRIRGIEAAYIQLGHDIEQEKDQVALGQLGGRAMGLLLVALRLPRTIGFATGLAHDHSPHG